MFTYDPDTGLLTRRVPSSRRPIGQTLKPNDPKAYFSVAVNGKSYLAHRLIWKYVTGDDPVAIDHINGLRGDNRLVNLRAVDATQNAWNRVQKARIESGLVGVVRSAGGLKWKALVLTPEGQVAIGPITTPVAASEAREQLLLLYRSEHHPSYRR